MTGGKGGSHGPTDETLRALYQASMSAGSEGCPNSERLAALAAGDVDASERKALADHVVSCRRCATDYRLLRALDEPEQTKPPVVRLMTLVGRRSSWSYAAAAALVLGVTIPVVWRSMERGWVRPPASVRSMEERAMSPADGSELAHPPDQLLWGRFGGRPPYRIRLFDEQANPLWERRDIETNSAPLPESIRRQLASGGAFMWLVEGTDAGAEAGPFWFHVRRNEP